VRKEKRTKKTTETETMANLSSDVRYAKRKTASSSYSEGEQCDSGHIHKNLYCNVFLVRTIYIYHINVPRILCFTCSKT